MLLALLFSIGCSGVDRVEHAVPLPVGVPRAVSASAPALVINEVMADPNAVTDANGEWFELYNTTSAAIDIQGYRIASAGDPGFTVTSAVIVAAGGYVVLGRVASPAINGKVAVDY